MKVIIVNNGPRSIATLATMARAFPAEWLPRNALCRIKADIPSAGNAVGSSRPPSGYSSRLRTDWKNGRNPGQNGHTRENTMATNKTDANKDAAPVEPQNGTPDAPSEDAAIVSAQAELDQLEKQQAALAEKVQKARDEQNARVLAQALSGAMTQHATLGEDLTAGRITEALAASRSLTEAIIEVAKAQGIKVGRGSGGTRGNGSQTGSAKHGGLQNLQLTVLAEGFIKDPSTVWTNAMIAKAILAKTGDYNPSTGAIGNNNSDKFAPAGWVVETDVNGVYAVTVQPAILAHANVPGTTTPEGDKN